MSKLAHGLSFSQLSIFWEQLTLPMKKDGHMSDRDAAELSYILANEAPILKEAEDRQKRILDANYKAVDIDAKVEAMDYLNDQ